MRVLIETYTCINHQISDNEVFEFKCSQGLLFDVSRQICDFKTNVDNCDVASGITIYIIHTINRIKTSTDLMSISTRVRKRSNVIHVTITFTRKII